MSKTKQLSLKLSKKPAKINTPLPASQDALMDELEEDRGEKHYLDIDVYTAAIERLNRMFDDFPNYFISFSGGKDSSIALHLTLQEARKRGRLPVQVLFIDLEAQYQATIRHITEMLIGNPDVKIWWVCLPLTLRNAVSMYQPQWICWDKTCKDLWVRPMPSYEGVIHEDNLPHEWKDWFYVGMEFEEFIIKFGLWVRDTSGGLLTATIIAIRADESLHRMLAVKKIREESKYKGIPWTTKVRKNLYNLYPIYDWKTQDIWTAIGKFGWKYNKIYDLMYMTGRSIHDMRICQPYGDDQRKGLDLFRKVEPETWFKIVQRVAGANFGNIYRGLKILGNGRVIKPSHLTWRDYANFLLNTIPKFQAHIYQERIEQFLTWWEEHGWERSLVPDATLPKSDKRWINPGGEQWPHTPSWERIAKCILKNDILCHSLSFGCVVGGYPRYQRLREQYGE